MRGRGEVMRCTLVENTAEGGFAGGLAYGGGVDAGILPVSFTNCTITGNWVLGSPVEGGGLWLESDSLLESCTVAFNWAMGGRGGGLSAWGTPQIMNCIFADNGGPYYENGPDIYGSYPLQSLDYNLIETTGGYTLTGATDHNVIGVDPNLEHLSNNGGPTLTHALLSPSPAIDAIPLGVNSCTPPGCIDQRGYVRAGGPGWGGDACDMGAYEYDTRVILFADDFETGNTSAWSATLP